MSRCNVQPYMCQVIDAELYGGTGSRVHTVSTQCYRVL